MNLAREQRALLSSQKGMTHGNEDDVEFCLYVRKLKSAQEDCIMTQGMED